MIKIKEFFKPSRLKEFLKSRSLLFHICAAIFTVCFITLVVLNIISAVQEKTNTATGITGYTVALEDGTDIIFTGTVAKADMKKKITLQYTLSGNAYVLEVEHENGVFATRVRVGPGQMNDIIQAQLMVNDRVADATKASVKLYCMSVLEEGSEAPDALKVLVSDMLRYGYESQMYIGEHQAAEDLLEGVPLVEGTPYEPPAYTDIDEGEGEVSITGKRLLLMNTLALCFSTDARMEDGYNVDEEGKLYIWSISITSFFDPVQIGVYKGGKLVSNKITYSASAYVHYLAEHEDIGPLMRSLYCYAMSTHRYLGCSFDKRQSGATCQSEGRMTKDCNCGIHEEEILPIAPLTHASITKTYVTDSHVQLRCDDCGGTWTSAERGAWQNDGTTTSHLLGYPNNRFFNGSDDRLPVRDEAGYLSWLRQADSDTTIDEFQMTIPTGASGIQASNDAQAFVSMRIRALGEPAIPSTDADERELLQLILVEDGNGSARWSADWCIQIPLVHVNDEGLLLGWDGVILGMYTDEWIELDIVLSFEDGVDEKTGEPIKNVRAVYYANGEGKGTAATRCTTTNQGFNALHITGYTEIADSGMAIDDIIFAY